jgi:hypothetical protein
MVHTHRRNPVNTTTSPHEADTLKTVVNWLCRLICPREQQYTASFTEEEAKRIYEARQKLRQWLQLARAGVIGAPAQGDIKSAVMDIVDVGNKLYEWYVPPFTINTATLSEQELQYVIRDLQSKGGMQGWLRLDGTYYTTDMETFKKIISWDWTDTRKYILDKFDCLLPDTPIIYKDPVTGEIDIEEVQNLPQEGGFYVLDTSIDDDELRWSRVNWVRPKYSSKRIVTVASPQGFIQTTEDHRFWVNNEWHQIGEFSHLKGYEEMRKAKLTTPKIEKLFRDDVELDPDLAWVYGLFLAEGSAKSFTTHTGLGYNFHIDMCNEDVLIKAKEILENHFNTKFEVYLPPSQEKGEKRGGVSVRCDLYRLTVRDKYGSGKKIASRFIQMFYTESNKKKVPIIMLNATPKAKRKFIEGVMLGDGTVDKNIFVNGEKVYKAIYKRLWQKSRVAMLGLEIILRKLNIPHRYYYYERKNGRSYVILSFRDDETNRKPRQPLFYVNNNNNYTLVYDLNTETGHFVASTFLVHNCDKYALYFKSRVTIDFGVNAVGVIIDYSARHAYNLVIIKDPSTRKVSWYLLEPQSDSIFTYEQRNKRFYAMENYYLIL